MADPPLFDLRLGNALSVLKGLEAESIDACVTDPPAGIEFMGKEWDSFKDRRRSKGWAQGGKDGNDGFGGFAKTLRPAFCSQTREDRENFIAFLTEVFVQARRVLRPGAHALVWALPRTSHWTATAIEDAGFQVRDVITHHFASGFPKSRNLGDGRGTALKPASEHWILARVPLSAATAASNVAAHGTGVLNIDLCRIRHNEPPGRPSVGPHGKRGGIMGETVLRHRDTTAAAADGRWPANLVLSHTAACRSIGKRKIKASADRLIKPGTSGTWEVRGSKRHEEGCLARGFADADGCETVEAWECADGCPVAELDRQSGILHTHPGTYRADGSAGLFGLARAEGTMVSQGDTGGASRFFFVAKPSTSEKEAGCGDLPPGTLHRTNPGGLENDPKWGPVTRRNTHPTVKPTELMRWLCRLITPKGGTVLDCFAGSGTTGVAAVLEGFGFIGIEQDAGYIEIARARLADAAKRKRDMPLVLEGLAEEYLPLLAADTEEDEPPQGTLSLGI